MVVGEFTQECDLLIIGAGPGGYAAAFRAAELGQSVTIVDSRSDLGGVCLHEGCIPSKTLLHIARQIREAEAAAQFGIMFQQPKIDLDAIRAWLDKTVAMLAKGLDSKAKKLGIQRLTGTARFDDGKNVSIAGGSVPRVKFRRCIIATGSTQAQIEELPGDSLTVLSPQQALTISTLPAKLLIVGHDYMAVELAMIYAALGSAVTLATSQATLLPEVDADIRRPLERRLKEQLAALSTNVERPTELANDDSFDAVIVSERRVGNTSSLNLNAADVTVDVSGFIVVDETMRTGNPRIFAVGDVTGLPQLADLALAQGKISAEVIAGQPSVFDARSIPHVIFTDPEIAWCGLTESQAKRDDVPHAIAKLPWGASGRAVGMGRHDGLTKVIYDPETQVIDGIGLVGSGVSEMIGEASLAIEMGTTLEDLAATIHPHPTRVELLADAANAAIESNKGNH